MKPDPVAVPPPPDGSPPGETAKVPERQPQTSSAEDDRSVHIVGRHVCVTEAATDPETPATGFAECHARPKSEVVFRSDLALPCGPCAFELDEQQTNAQRRDWQATACCYLTRSPPLGRPVRAGAGVIIAESTTGDGWRAALAPETASLDAALRAKLARAWSGDALLEHASVASFARFSLELLALGAPADLVRAAHAAALDEIAHAETCFALASAYAGAGVAPGSLRVASGAERTWDVLELVDEVFIDGCVGETRGALEARAAADAARDPVVRCVLERIASDEESHAELAWRALAWLLAREPSARARVERRLRDVAAALPETIEADPRAGELEIHGRLGDAARSRIASECVREIVVPCARALLDPTIDSTRAFGHNRFGVRK